MQVTPSVHTPAPQITGPAPLVNQLKGLKPPARSFAARCWDRFVGKRSMSADKMQLAQLAHSTLYRYAPGTDDKSERFDDAGESSRDLHGKDKDAVADFVHRFLVTRDGQSNELDWTNPAVVANEAAKQFKNEWMSASARNAFQVATAGQIRKALAEAIGAKSVWITRFQREDLADVIYAACVGALGERDHEQADHDFEKQLRQLPKDDVKARVRGLRALERRFQHLLLDIGTRNELLIKYRPQIHQQLKDSAGEWLAQLKEELTLATPMDELRNRMAELDRLEAGLPQGGTTWKLAEGCAELRSKLTLLSRREADQKALKTVCPKLATVLEFKDEHPSHQVRDPAEAYFQARRSLDTILASAGPLHEDLARSILNDGVMDANMLETLSHIADGDSSAIDMMFPDASQIEVAQTLKLAGSLRKLNAQAGRLSAESADPTKDPADIRKRFEQLDADRSRRLQDIEVEHAFRTVSALLTDAQLAIASRKTGILERLRSQKRPEPSVSIFKGSVLADARTIRLLGVAASELKTNADFLIADFIRLSHAYAGTSGKPGVKDIDKSISEALEKLKADGSLQRSADEIQRLVAQGFRSSQEVAACSARIAGFITQLKQAPDLKATEEELFVHVKAQRVLQSIVQKWNAPAVAGGSPVEQDLADPVLSARLKERLHGARPWLRPEYESDRQELVAVKQSLATYTKSDDFNSFAGQTPERTWVDDSDGMQRVRDWLNPAYKAILLDDKFQQLKEQPRTPDSAAQIIKLSKQRNDELAKLAGLNLVTLTKHPDKGISPTMHDLDRIKGSLVDLDKAITLQSKLLDVEAASKEDKFDVKTAVRMAVLQEAAASPDADWPTALMPRVRQRLADLGLSDGAIGDKAKKDWIRTSEKLDQYATKSLSELVTAWDPRSAKDKAEIAARSLAEKAAAIAQGQAETLLEKSLRRNAGVIEDRVKQLQRGEAVDLRFGRYGEVEAGVPMPIPLISVSTKERVETSHLIRVSCDADGAYAVRMFQGRAVAASATVGLIGDLVSLTAGGRKTWEDGFRFTTSQKDGCLAFVKALASGDASDHAFWRGLQVEKAEASSSTSSGSVEAAADFVVGSISAGGEVVKGTSIEKRTSLGNTVEVRERSFQVSASAGVETLVEQLSADAIRGKDLRVAISDVRGGFGLVSEHTRVRVSSTLLNDDPNGPLSVVLPPTQKDELKALAAKMERLEAGGEVFVTYRLRDSARYAANMELMKAQRANAQAGYLPVSERPAASVRAKAAEKEAAAILGRPSNYLAEGLGWTRKTETQSTQRAGLHFNFANGTAERTESLRFEGEHPMPEALKLP